MRHFLLLAVLPLLASCSSFKLEPNNGLTPDEFRAHVLMFDARGEPRDPLTSTGFGHAYLRAEDTPEGEQAGEAYVHYMQRIFDGIDAHRARYPTRPLRLIFFFHGGLNTRGAALRRAEDQILRMKRDTPEVYPIFVNWLTSLPSSYKNHLLFVTHGQDTYRWGRTLAPFKFGGDVARFVANAVPDTALQVWDWKRRAQYEREGVLQAPGCNTTLDFREGDHATRSARARFTDSAHAFATFLIAKWWTGAIVDSAGTPAWGSMLYTADRLFYSDQEMHHPYEFSLEGETGGGDFSRFLEHLSANVNARGNTEVILAAHSAGAIVANMVVANFGDRLPITNLVYMAPACTIDELMAGGKLASFLAKHHDSQLHILTLNEVAEFSQKFVFDLAPRGSLLVWLDEFIQPKHSEFRGHMLGRARNLRLHAHLIPCAIQPQLHITAFAEDPAGPPHPQTHSDIGGIEYWKTVNWNPVDDRLRPLCVSKDPKMLRDPHQQSPIPPPASAEKCVVSLISHSGSRPTILRMALASGVTVSTAGLTSGANMYSRRRTCGTLTS
jgi:hypothetical protein